METNMKQLLSEIISTEIEMSLLYSDFMCMMQEISLQGFKRYYRCRAKDRVYHVTMLRNYAIDYLSTNIPLNVPAHVTGAMNGGISSINKIELALTTDLKYSNMQIKLLEKAASLAITQDEHALMGYIEDLIKDEEEELKCLNRIIKSWTFAKEADDTSWYDRTDKAMHKKKKKKEGSEYK